MSSSRRHVLLVEDNPAIRRALVLLLQAGGHVVTAAASVAEGLVRLDGQAVAVLDLRLPDGPGTTVLRAIRDRGLPMRVAVMSAGAGPALVAAMNGCPPDRYFTKPLDVDALVEWVGAE